ncbi:MAG: hypothetical protein WA021_00425 [Minisyncoccia bacterium]
MRGSNLEHSVHISNLPCGDCGNSNDRFSVASCETCLGSGLVPHVDVEGTWVPTREWIRTPLGAIFFREWTVKNRLLNWSDLIKMEAEETYAAVDHCVEQMRKEAEDEAPAESQILLRKFVPKFEATW